VELQENESKLVNKFQWFLFVGIIPLLFAVIVFVIVLTFAGFDVGGAAKKYGQFIPGVSSLIPTEEGEIDLEAKLRQDVNDLETLNQDQLAMVEQLEKEAEEKEGKITDLQMQIEKLNEELRTKGQQQQDKEQTLGELSKIYESMSAKNAAAILTELEDQDALTILRTLSTDTLGPILEKMEPVDAARFTKLLADEA
jgi:flagellar protein FlbB